MGPLSLSANAINSEVLVDVNTIWTVLTFALCFATAPSEAKDTGIRERVVSNHFQFVPSGEGPFPTIIAIPGCSGIALQDPALEEELPSLTEDDRLFRRHYLRMAEKLRDQGFAVLLIHVHAGEGLVTACGGQISGERIAQYIDEAVAWSRELLFVDSSRIHLVGWSMGGGGVLAWLHGTRSESKAVRSAVSIYPGCAKRSPLTNQTPLLLLLGSADDIAEPGYCDDLVVASHAKTTIEVRHYQGARHGFDIVDAPPVLEIGNGMTIGYDQAAAESSWREILAFLAD